ncbi:MAG: hypothetical protein ACYDCL_19605 [Myxococcales bacterium]
MKRLLAAALACGALAAGCNNACQNLANNICECSPTQIAQQNCNAATAIAAGTDSLTNDDLNRCNQWLVSCDCRMLASGSYAGKVACGLARPDPGDPSLSPSGQ